MADLALAIPTAFERPFAPEADVVVAPGRRGGTAPSSSGRSCSGSTTTAPCSMTTGAIAERMGPEVAAIDSFRLAMDGDKPADLIEVLLHGDSRARKYLGGTVELDVDESGVDVARADGENAFVNQ